MIPFFIILLGAGAIITLARANGVSSDGRTSNERQGIKASGERVGFQTQRFKQDNPYLYALLVKLKRGDEPDDWLINEAMAEAYDKGNWPLVAKLHRRFGEMDMDDKEDPEGEGEGEEHEAPERPTDDHGPADIVVGKNSPFEGVPNDAWDRFVNNLETQKPEYDGPKHVGRFHHSKDRLRELEIDDVSTADKQYDALVKDLTDSREKSDSLIKEWECKSVALKGEEKLVTLSGILAVVKSAGLDNARSWFDNPDDRTKFPKTTEMFLKANGVF